MVILFWQSEMTNTISDMNYGAMSFQQLWEEAEQ